MADEQEGSEKRRIEALEMVVRSLVGKVDRLSADVARLSGDTAAVAVPAAAAEAPRPAEMPAVGPISEPATSPPVWTEPVPPRRPSASRKSASSGDLEQLVGRYGTLVVATLALLLGLGAFLQWAVARGLLGPEVRLALGAVAALVLAGLGLWMRGKGSTRYGNALLAIALAVVHLDAWAAGPGLGIVAPMLALSVAAVASLALAALAIRQNDEFLFCLGLGGAMLAPFVTMAGEGSPAQLLFFGGLVLAASIVALREAAWQVAPRLVPLFALWYAVAGAEARTSEMSSASAYWPAAFALALSLVSLALGARGVRRGLVSSLIFVLAVTILTAGNAVNAPPWSAVTYALLGALTAHASRRRAAASEDGGPDTWFEVVGAPLLLLFCAVAVDDRYKAPEGAAIAAVWVALTAVFLLLDGATRRSRHLAVILTAAFVASVGLFHGNEVARVAAFSTVAVLAVFAYERFRGAALFLPIGLALFFGSLRSFILYDQRDAWTYTPFMNDPSLAAATVVAAALLLSWVAPPVLASSGTRSGPWRDDTTLTMLRVLGPLAAFVWVRAELAEAFSSDIATFLLITYYALTGVGAILLGRARAVSALRQTGLVLSLYAAWKVVMEASDVDRVGLRVGSYLVVGVFLLGVGYLYRAGVPDVASES